MRNIFFVTGNKNKYEEAKQIIPEIIQKDIDLTEIQEIDPKIIISYKLEEAKKLLSGNLVVEDTSLYIDGMNGLPGPLIRWFMKTIGEAMKNCVIFYTKSNCQYFLVFGWSRKDKIRF